MIELNDYDEKVISHHPTSIIYWTTHGIIIDEIRYVIVEYLIEDSKLIAILKKEDEDKLQKKYYKLEVCDISPDIRKILDRLLFRVSELENKKQPSTQTLSLSDKTLSISDGNSVVLPTYDDSEVKLRLSTLESRTDKDTIYDDSELRSMLNYLKDRPHKITTLEVDPSVENNLLSISSTESEDTVTYNLSVSKPTVEERFVQNSIASNTFYPTKERNNYKFDLTNRIDMSKQFLYIGFRFPALYLPRYTDGSTINAKESCGGFIVPLIGHPYNKQYNVNIQLANGDLVTMSGKYSVNGTNIVLSEVMNTVTMGRLTDTPKTVEFNFFGVLPVMKATIGDKEYIIRSSHVTCTDIVATDINIV